MRNTRNCSGCGCGSDDLQNLFQRRQAAAHLEGHLVCIVLLTGRERKRDNETEVQSGGDNSQGTSWTRDYMALTREATTLFSFRSEGIEIWHKVIPEVFLFNLKSAQPDSAPQQLGFNGRQILCRLQLAPGWSHPMATAELNWEKQHRDKPRLGQSNNFRLFFYRN